MAFKVRGFRTHSVSGDSSSSSSNNNKKTKAALEPKSTPSTPSSSPSASYVLQPAGWPPLANDARSRPAASPTASPAAFPASVQEFSFLVLDDAPSANPRDSILSIVEDPFFQRYDARGDLHGLPPTNPDPGPTSHPIGATDRIAATAAPPAAAWPPPRRDSLILNTSVGASGASSAGATASASALPPTMDTINIAVIGSDGVGKSSFIQRALRMQRRPSTTITPVRLDVEGVPLVCTLIELDLEYFDVQAGQPIRWPKQVGGHIIPRIDGALVLYDVMNKDSIRELPPTMAALAITAIPIILVATKCDNPESSRQLNTEGMSGLFPAVIADFKTSSNVPGSTRECLQAIIRASLSGRRGGDRSRRSNRSNRIGERDRDQNRDSDRERDGQRERERATRSRDARDVRDPKDPRDTKDPPDASLSRRRAASSAAHLEAPDTINGRPLSQHSKHSRASSDLSLLRGIPPPADYSRGQSRSPRITADYPNASPQLGGVFSSGVGNPSNLSDVINMADDNGGVTVSSMLRTHGGVRLDTGPDSFLDVDESDVDSFRNSDDIPILQRNDEAFLSDRPTAPAKMAGVEFDELVDRLLAPRMSRADNNFADIFLCLYRKFAAPGELFSAIHSRLERVRQGKGISYLADIATQLRIIEVVAKWVSLYPGDFARSTTRKKLEDLIRRLASEPIFTAAAQQMRGHLERSVVEDDDTGWAKADEPDKEPTTPGGGSGAALTQSQSQKSVATKESGRSGGGALSDSMSSLQLEESGGRGGGRWNQQQQQYYQHHPQQQQQQQQHPSQRPFGDTDAQGGGRSTAQFQFHSLEDYEQEAATMVPTATLPLNKIRYHIFLDKDTDDIADEITRIDWVMFSSIRIRDLVRAVSLSADEKERCRSLDNVNRMISHFNHLAKWVANMILIRDKAKHRAPCLEKFMQVALRLRVLNNYNGLAAVLAGINGTSVHRLTQTRALVSPEVQRRFARLVLLMGTQKSHFAYRLAWENSPLPRIPFMALHRRDLVGAEEGSRTFVGPAGDRINWKKFEVLGEVVLPLMKSQGTPYPNLRKDDASRELILDCKMPTDEDEIWQRSIQVEPASGSAESSKKKFPWLAK